jgi:hypothetical protein
MPVNYRVPGIVTVIRQPNSLLCWATAYTMMRSWKHQQSFSIREAVAAVDASYGTMFDNNRAMPAGEFTRFLRLARMTHQPMWNIPIEEWTRLLRTHGLLWVGTLGVVSRGTYLHSRLVEAIAGDGSGAGTRFHIVDPENGSRYTETFDVFLQRYERAFIHSQPSNPARFREYFQIRHY